MINVAINFLKKLLLNFVINFVLNYMINYQLFSPGNQSEYQDYLNRQLNRPTPAAIVNTTSPANNDQPPSYESIFGARRFYTSPAARRETLETKLENLSTKLIVDIQFLMSQYENDKRFLVRQFYENQ